MLLALIQDLLRSGMDKATDVILTGCSGHHNFQALQSTTNPAFIMTIIYYVSLHVCMHKII